MRRDGGGRRKRCTCKQALAIKGAHNEMRESPPPPAPGAVPLGSGIRCSDFGAVNPGGRWKLREPPSWGQCKTLGSAGGAGLQRLAGLYLHAGLAGNRGGGGVGVTARRRRLYSLKAR